MGEAMTEPEPLPPLVGAPVDETTSQGVLRRPAVLAGLALYFAALGLAAVLLSQSNPAPLPKAAFPSYEVDTAWVADVFPQIYRESPPFAEIRFRDRVDELRWQAELYERQKCWRKAKVCYDAIAQLVRSESHPVIRYVRERTKALSRLEP